jgi:UPF0755 protein
MAKKKASTSKFIKVLKVLLVLSVAGFLLMIADFYRKIYYPNINLKERTTTYIYIPTGAVYDDVVRILLENNILLSLSSFEWLARQVDYPDNVHPGKYLIKKSMNNKDLLLLLRSGRQTPVKVTFNNIRRKEELAGRLSRYLEPDSLELITLLTDDEYLSKYGFDSRNVLSLFIPNTYELYWNTSSENLIRKMYKEYRKFWSQERLNKAKSIGLTPAEVAVMASIVEQETHRDEEKETIAGVYMNRLRKGYRLEADPTLVYALGDFTIKRVLNEYKKLDSPYNTYMYTGLPPGPICMPSISSLEAVLNYRKHDYFYFCAKEDFSGLHVFARTYPEHLINARRYQRELNRRNIRS